VSIQTFCLSLEDESNEDVWKQIDGARSSLEKLIHEGHELETLTKIYLLDLPIVSA
jgi:hypothetical protein